MAPPDLDIEKIAQSIDGEEPEEGAEAAPEVDGEEQEEGVEENADEESEEDEEGGGPSFMPDLMGGADEPPPQNIKHKKSMLDTATAVSVVALLKQELHKIDCNLKDYRIEFTVNGVDINNITVGTADVEALRARTSDLDDEEKARIASKVTTLAMVAVNDALKERVKQELGLDLSLFEYENADIGAASLGFPEPEEPEEANPIQDIANSIEVPPMAGETPPEAPALPGSEEMPVEPGLEGAPDMGAMPPAAPDVAGAPPAVAPEVAAPAAPPMPM